MYQETSALSSTNLFDFISWFISTIASILDQARQVVPFVDYIFYFLFAFIIFHFLFRGVQKITKKYFKIIDDFQYKVYRVTIPNTLKDDDPEKKKDFKQVLQSFEAFFYNIAGIKAEGYGSIKDNILYRFKDRSDHFAMEIVNDNDDMISFYFALPPKLDALIRQQITGVWPDSFIEEMEDYNIFKPNQSFMAAEFLLKKEYSFPIKNYEKFESDPLDVVLNSISKFTKDDGVIIQLLARSSRSSWRNYGKKFADLVNEGKTIEQAHKEIGSSKILSELGKMAFIASGKKAEDAPKPKTQTLSPADQEMIKAIENKNARTGMDVNIRIIIASDNKDKRLLKQKLQNITNSFNQYGDYGLLNSFKTHIPKRKKEQKKLMKNIIYRNFKETPKVVLSSDELITLFHLPLPSCDVSNVRWLRARTAAATFKSPEIGVTLGTNTYRGIENIVRVSPEDRMRHTYIIGKSGVGKTNIMKDMAIQDAIAGNGFCIIDPHGDFAENVLALIPKERAEDVIYFDPSDLERPIGLNLYEFDENSPEQKTLVVNQFIEMLYTMYSKDQIGGPMFEYYTKNALLLNMEDVESGNTMIEIAKVMADEEFRHMKLSKTKNPLIKDFWIKEAEKAGGDAALANIVPYITSKLNQFIFNDFMRNIIGQQKSTINFSDIMNTKKILICNLSKGKIGDMNTQLLGLIITGRILISALKRAELDPKDRHPFFLYIDECQNFLTPAITTILAEARKYGLGLILANQFITQLVKDNNTTIKDGIFGNAGTLVAFRISTEDAEFMEKIMAPVFSRFDLENAPSGRSCAKTLVDNTATKPFSLDGREYWKIFGDPYSQENKEKMNYFRELSRLKYGRPRDIVNKEILERIGIGQVSTKDNIEDELKRLFGE